VDVQPDVRIALIGPAYPDQGGGARHTTELAHRLTAAGHNVVIESWRPRIDQPDGEEYPRTYRRLARHRPDRWIAAGRRLRSADLVVFALLSSAQVPSYLSVLSALTVGLHRPRTALICHAVLPPDRLTRTLLAHVDTVIVHSAAAAARVREQAPDVPIVIPAAVEPELYWAACLRALQIS
jgi:glycosyltransferase involved in cell wall biosynthesis